MVNDPVNKIDLLGLDTITASVNVDISTPVDIFNFIFGTDIIGNGGGIGIAVSFPGLNGGELDIGAYITGAVNKGTGIAGKKYGVSANAALGYCAGSVRDLHGRSGQIGFNDGIGGMSLQLDGKDNIVGADVHLGRGYSAGASESLTATLSLRRGILH